MTSRLTTIQFNLNHWHLGMSLESHLFLKEILKSDNSHFILVSGLSDNEAENRAMFLKYLQRSRNVRNLARCVSELPQTQFVHESSSALDILNFVIDSSSHRDYFGILESAPDRFGIEKNEAELAVKLGLIDKLKLWRTDVYDNSELARYFLCRYIATYLLVENLFKKYSFNVINLFNSRFLNEKAVKDFALKRQIAVHEFEQVNLRSDSFGSFASYVHNPIERAEMARDFYTQTTTLQKEFGHYKVRWLEGRRERKLQNFTRRQVRDNLPQFPKNRKVISCFLSSFDEMILAGYATANGALNQDSAIEPLVKLIEKRDDWFLVIRCHPNMLTRPQEEQRYWVEKLAKLNALVLEPGSEVDSYALINASSLVFSFGSTISIEALAMGKPSVVMGPALYSGHKMIPECNSPEEILNFLDSVPIPSERDLNELEAYCCFQLEGGIRFKLVQVEPGREFEFNPRLYKLNRKFLAPDRNLRVYSLIYSKIQVLKNWRSPFTSKHFASNGCE